jgi:hypothetical protein
MGEKPLLAVVRPRSELREGQEDPDVIGGWSLAVEHCERRVGDDGDRGEM